MGIISLSRFILVSGTTLLLVAGSVSLLLITDRQQSSQAVFQADDCQPYVAKKISVLELTDKSRQITEIGQLQYCFETSQYQAWPIQVKVFASNLQHSQKEVSMRLKSATHINRLASNPNTTTLTVYDSLQHWRPNQPLLDFRADTFQWRPESMSLTFSQPLTIRLGHNEFQAKAGEYQVGNGQGRFNQVLSRLP